MSSRMTSSPDDVDDGLSDSASDNDGWATTDSDSDEVEAMQQLVEKTPQDHPFFARYLHMLGKAFGNRYEDGRDLNDLQTALFYLQEAVKLTQPDDLDRVERLESLAAAFSDQYESLEDINDLNSALKLEQEIVDLTPVGHPDRARRLQNLSVSFGNRYQKLGNVQDLEAALRMDQEVLDLTPAGHPDRPGYLQTLSTSLTDRYKRLGNLDDLEAALRLDQEAVQLTPTTHHKRSKHLKSLAMSLQNRYQRFGDLKDLEAALQANQEAVDLVAAQHPQRLAYIEGLADLLKHRYERLGELSDLEASLQMRKEVLNQTTEKDPDRAGRQRALAICLRTRHQRTGDLKDLEAAWHIAEEMVKHTPTAHPDRAKSLVIASLLLSDRYHRLGDPRDEDTAPQMEHEIISLTSHGHPNRPERLRNFAVSLTERYRRIGTLEDLDAALQAEQEAASLIPPDHADRAMYLRNLAISLRERYESQGGLKDLDAAVKTAQEAVDLVPGGHPNKAAYLDILGGMLRERYQRLGDPGNLTAAVEKYREAVSLTPGDHPERAEHLRNLAVSLTDQYRRLGDLKDLDTAIQAELEAVAHTPLGHLDPAEILQNLAASFTDRYRRLRDMQDLEAALKIYKDAIGLTPTHHPKRPERLHGLALSYTELSWTAALNWAAFSEELDSSYAAIAYSFAFSLLPEILWISNDVKTRQKTLRWLAIGPVASMATHTCIELGDLKSAVEILEQGLATTFQQMLELKTDVDTLPAKQAAELRKLSSKLYNGTAADSTSVAIKRKDMLADIRKQPGFESFLLPKPFSILCRGSQGGPIVVLNSHERGCDGIIILNPDSEPVHVPLPGVTFDLLKTHQNTLKNLLGRCNVRIREESNSSRLFGRRQDFTVRTTAESFEDLLTWMSINIIDPVYQGLSSHGIQSGRLWWLPTGVFIGLPLHAADRTDQFIHSYTATLGSLLESQGKMSTSIQKVGVVGVTHTSMGGGNYLRGVKREVQKIRSACDTGGFEKSTTELSMASSRLPRNPRFNSTNQEPLAALGSLELETVLQIPLENSEFVFLAACQTAKGDAELTNESFHLSGGLIAAGFRSAVGTLWAMNDLDGPAVAETFYGHLFRDGRQPRPNECAEALQLAIRELRAKGVPYERWIPFIHMGV
ncbi:hypothetical protein B0H19DRAFT_1077163 [Mycena capillaripes]|nr:hypothetical protein B0H19DRAFT_1077163 [Mycena capillaripes]